MPIRAARTTSVVLAVALALVATACSSSSHAAASKSSGPSSTVAASVPSSTAASVPPTTANPTRPSPPSTAFASGVGLNPISRAWSAPLDGTAVYAKPVIAGGRVFVATEGDDVYALNEHDGRVLWQHSIGTPLADVAGSTGCGDIDPLGITSTPVVDNATGTLYVVGEVRSGTGNSPIVHHELVGFNMATGAVTREAEADPPLPPGESPLVLLQRASLLLANGRIYVGFGGNFGDCGDYHGWLVGVAESPSTPAVAFEAAPDGQGGAIWEPGGPVVDAAGDVYVTTGNAEPFPPQGGPDPKKYTESAVKLSPQLGTPLASFKDTTAGGDDDLAADSPTLLPSGRADGGRGDVFVVGKTDIGYRLAATDLHQVAAVQGVCGSDPDGTNAVDEQLDSLYVPCRGGGIQEVNLASNTLGWRAGDVNSSPVLVDGQLWALEYPTGTLEQLAPNDGHVVQRVAVGEVPTFASPASGAGLLAIGTTHGVAAYQGPAGPPPG